MCAHTCQTNVQHRNEQQISLKYALSIKMGNSVNLHTNFILTLFQTGITYFLLWKNKNKKLFFQSIFCVPQKKKKIIHVWNGTKFWVNYP